MTVLTLSLCNLDLDQVSGKYRVMSRASRYSLIPVNFRSLLQMQVWDYDI